MKVAAIIPARKGSKRVVGKNMAMLGGRPLVAWTREAAFDAFDDTSLWFSTDCPRVTKEAARLNDLVMQRPARLCGERVPLKDVVRHWLRNMAHAMEEQRGVWDPDHPPDAICLLQPTSPFRTAEHIDAAIKLMKRTKCDTVVSVTHDGGGYFAGEVDKRGKYKPGYSMRKRPRTQDVNRYRENGAIYLVRTSYFERTGELVGGDMRALVLDPIAGLDINEPHELEYARWLVETGRVRA